MHRMHQWICLCGIITLNCAVAGTLEPPRFNAYSGYTRLVFDAPLGAQYRLEPLGAALRVTFWDTQVKPGLLNVNKPELSGLTINNGNSNAIIDIATPQGVSQRRGFRVQQLSASKGKTGYRLVLDFSGAFADISKMPSINAPALEKTRGQNFTVLLDPGHGGTDPGAVGNGLTESNLNLNVAFRIKKWLESSGVAVEMTRTDNRVYSKDKRTDLNARTKASRGKTAFISIHANARPPVNARKTFGMEVYYFDQQRQNPLFVTPALAPSVTSTTSALEPLVTASTPIADADVVNEIIEPVPTETTGGDQNPVTHYSPSIAANAAEAADGLMTDPAMVDGFETPDATAPILSDVTQTSEPLPVLPLFDRAASSKDLASHVLGHMLGATGAYSRGVLTGDYYVIRNSLCPAILLEMGFVTHPVEAEQLKNSNYLDRISYGVAKGIVQYLESTATTTLLQGGQKTR